MRDIDLIKEAEGKLNPRKIGEGTYLADVGCALISESGNVYSGACIGGNLGLCAEQSAFSNMLSTEGPEI